MNELLSVVLGTYNRLPYLQLTIGTVRKEVYGLPHELIVIDGGSLDGTTEWLAQQKDVSTIVQNNHGARDGRRPDRQSWGHFMNLGFRSAQGTYVCMLSDDCLVVPGCIRNGLARMREERARGTNVGAVAFYWRNWPEQDTYRVGLTLGDKMFVNHGIYLADALAHVGFADEETYGFYHADGDLCLKMWAHGYSCIDSPDSYIEHYAHANKRLRRSHFSLQKRDWENYLARWEGVFYSRAEGNEGGWIERPFIDPHRTAALFEALGPRAGGKASRQGLMKGFLRRVFGRSA